MTTMEMSYTNSQLRRAQRALRFYSRKSHTDAINEYEALLRSTAWQIAKDQGLSTVDEALPKAMEVLGVIG